MPFRWNEPTAVRFRLLLTVFPPILGLHRLGGLHRLHRLVDLPVRIRFPRPWTAFRTGSPAGPSVGRLLLAGLAVFAFVKLMSAAHRPNRSKPTVLVTALLLLAVGALVMSFRRSARRSGW
jgi:hypothetical protein